MAQMNPLIGPKMTNNTILMVMREWVSNLVLFSLNSHPNNTFVTCKSISKNVSEHRELNIQVEIIWTLDLKIDFDKSFLG